MTWPAVDPDYTATVGLSRDEAGSWSRPLTRSRPPGPMRRGGDPAAIRDTPGIAQVTPVTIAE